MSDQRFAALQTNPQYRLPSKKQSQTAVDSRFKSVLTDPGFRKKASVDRYGRKVKSNDEEKSLKKRFRVEEEVAPTKAKAGAREVVGSSDEDSVDEDDDELDGAVKDPARHGGFSESSDEEDDDSEVDGDSEDEDVLAEETAGREQTEDVPMGEPSRRIAAVNLDWDNIRAADIMVVANSFVPAGGKIQSVVIYPSEFGRERLEREQMDGPPREIFASSNRKNDSESESESEEDEASDSDSDAEEKIRKRLLADQAASGQEFNPTKLREYQIERLKYYYAVITCDTIATAKALSDAMDGRELLTTANIFDLRFIPDEVSFDDDRSHEECYELPHGYKPNEFRTEALTHSKVRLTWDDDDPSRKEVQKRAFSRKEIDDNDMLAYIASDNSDADSVSSRKSAAETKRAKKVSQMRDAFGLSVETTKSKKVSKDEPVGDMQITFSAGLTTSANGNNTSVFENGPQDEASTLERYRLKEKERKQQRKNRRKAALTGEPAPDVAIPAPLEDAGFDDVFFTDPKAAKEAEKAAKREKRNAAKQPPAPPPGAVPTSREELALLLSDDEAAGVGHFDMREIEKAEKAAKRKGKGKKKGKKGNEAVGQDGFEVDAGDERFGALFERSEFAIDPSHTKFKGTKGMKTLLEEGRKKRKGGVEVEDEGEGKKRRKRAGEIGVGAEGGDDVKGLVARLKKPSRKG